MEMATAIVIVSLITTMGMVGVTQLINHNYFKKQTFLHKLRQEKRIDGLKIKKLEREMGLKATKQSNDSLPQNNPMNDLIQAGISKYLEFQESNDQGDDDGEEKTDITTEILKYARENPEVAQAFLSKINLGGNKNNEEEGFPSQS
jgi:hypothetical protein